ncbi:MAG: tyrosine-type recombinase/integrase [Chloroflexi bacterium]|nr:tyrosine-type recombinase/integrase [Chloroflexota bacterium]
MRKTVSAALGDYCIFLEAQGRSSKTINTYRQRLSTFVDLYGETPLEDLAPADVDAWMVKLRRIKKRWEEHPTKPTKEGELAKATLSSRLQAAKTFLNWCVARGYMERSPAAHLRRIRYGRSEKVMRPSDLSKMLAEVQDSPRDRALIMFIADTGARAGEVATLKLEDLNLENCEAKVNGKTDTRLVDFTLETAEALRAWLAERPECDNNRVFVGTFRNHRGRPLQPGGITQLLARVGERAGTTGPRNPHAIRHLVGQHYVDNENLVIAQEKLGHSDIAITAEFYSHQDRGRIKAATERSSLIRQPSRPSRRLRRRRPRPRRSRSSGDRAKH